MIDWNALIGEVNQVISTANSEDGEELICYGSLKRDWGIIRMDRNGTPDFERLVPGGERLPAGYQAHYIIQPLNPEMEEVEVHILSAPWSGRGDEEVQFREERVLEVLSPKTEFPNRRLRVDLSLSNALDALLVSVVDLCSGNRVDRKIKIELEGLPELGKRPSYAETDAPPPANDVGEVWSGYYTGYYSDASIAGGKIIRSRR